MCNRYTNTVTYRQYVEEFSETREKLRLQNLIAPCVAVFVETNRFKRTTSSIAPPAPCSCRSRAPIPPA
jgi:hypothetical protein